MRLPLPSARELVLAAHPTTRGYGWILFDGPHSPVDWGTVSAKPKRQSRLTSRFERILKRHSPDTVVLEEFDGAAGRRGERAQELSRAMLELARSASLKTAVYPRFTVQARFAGSAANTRYEIAQAVAKEIEALQPRLPNERKPWMPEAHTQSLFDAAALALTHFAKAGPS